MNTNQKTQIVRCCRAGAAGIASMTHGRKTTFSSKGPVDDSANEIAEALEDRANKVPKGWDYVYS